MIPIDIKTEASLAPQAQALDEAEEDRMKTIVVDQPLDDTHSREVEMPLIEAISSGVEYINIDMSRMEFMTATGAMLMVRLCMNVSKGQHVLFTNPNSSVTTLLKTIGLVDYIHRSS